MITLNIIEYFEIFALKYEEHIMWVVLLFSFLHPLTENPWSFFTLSLAITALGVGKGYVLLIVGYITGIIVLYFIMRFIHQIGKFPFSNKKNIQKVLNWVSSTSTLRHIIVIGLPNIPTYPIKVILPLTKMSFIRYFITLLGSYLFLTTMNSLLYFGVFSLLGLTVPKWVAILLILIFVVIVYFGKDLKKQYLLKV